MVSGLWRVGGAENRQMENASKLGASGSLEERWGVSGSVDFQSSKIFSKARARLREPIEAVEG
jgi:hypothetical protein